MIYSIIENHGVKKRISINHKKLLFEPTINMEQVEYWESRLTSLGFPYILVECKQDRVRGFSIVCPKMI